jgi:hypothetical protein
VQDIDAWAAMSPAQQHALADAAEAEIRRRNMAPHIETHDMADAEAAFWMGRDPNLGLDDFRGVAPELSAEAKRVHGPDTELEWSEDGYGYRPGLKGIDKLAPLPKRLETRLEMWNERQPKGIDSDAWKSRTDVSPRPLPKPFVPAGRGSASKPRPRIGNTTAKGRWGSTSYANKGNGWLSWLGGQGESTGKSTTAHPNNMLPSQEAAAQARYERALARHGTRNVVVFPGHAEMRPAEP